MSAFKYFTKIDIVKHVKASGGLTVRVQRRRPEQRRLKLKRAWELNSGLWFTDDSRPLTGSTNLIWTVVDWVASGMHKRHS